MFCSNCGKTLPNSADTCPYCGMSIGESRFEASRGYTGAQDKIRPGQAVRINGIYGVKGNNYPTRFTVESDHARDLPSDEDVGYRAVPGAGVSGYGEDDDREPLFNVDGDDGYEDVIGGEEERPAEEEPAEETETKNEPEEEERPAAKSFFRFLHREDDEEEEEEDGDGDSDGYLGDETGAKPSAGKDGADEEENEDDDNYHVEAEIRQPVGISEDVRRFMTGLREEQAQRREREAEEERRKAERAEKRKKRGKPAPVQTETEEEDEDIPTPAKKASRGKTESEAKKSVKPVKTAEPEEEDDEDDLLDDIDSGFFGKVKGLFSKKHADEEFDETDEDEDATESEQTDESTETDPSEDGYGEDEEEQSEEEPEEEEEEEKPAREKRISRRNKRVSRGFFKHREEEDFSLDDEEEDEEEDEDENEFEDEFDDETISLSLQRESRLRFLKYILLALVIVAIILGIIVGISYMREETKTAPVENVTLPLWNEGIELIQERVGSSYRNEMLALYDVNDESSFITLSAAMTAELDGLSDLLPPNEQQMLNDQRFVEALKSIQQSINNCLTNDVLAMTDSTKTSKQKNSESSARWEQVRSYVTTLTQATNAGMLDGIIKGERVELISAATPEPEPTPTPQPYTKLAKGANGEAVVKLQTRLTVLGYMNSTVDGDYGSKTKTAVEKFQQKAGLKVTGIADIETQEALFADDAPRN